MIDKSDPRLTAFLLDELDGQEAADVQAAIDASPELREHVDDLRLTIGSLNSILGTTDSAAMTDSQLEEIDRAASSVPSSVANEFALDYRAIWRRFAIAALVVYAVGISFFAFRKPEALPDTARFEQPKQVKQAEIPTVALPTPHYLQDDRDKAVLSPRPERRIPALVTLGKEDARQDGREGLVTSSEGVASAVQDDSGPRSVFMSMSSGTRLPSDEPAMDEMMGGMDETMGGMDGMMTDDMAMGDLGTQGRTLGDRAKGFRPSSAGAGQPDETPPPAGQTWDAAELDNIFLYIEPPQGSPSVAATEIKEEKVREEIALADVRYVPELDQVIIKGSKTDVERVRGIIDEIKAAREPDVALDSVEVDMRTPAIVVAEEEEAALTGFGPDTKEIQDRIERFKKLSMESNVLEKKQEEAQKNLSKLQAAQRSQLAALERKAKTWRPATASTNRARLSIGHHDDLSLAARDTYVRIDGFRARVFFDLYYYNDRPQQLEGQFLLRLPSDAALHYFAFGPTALSTPDAPPATNKDGTQTLQSDVAELYVNALRDQLANSGSDLARRAVDHAFTPEKKSLFGMVKPARVAPRQKAAMAYDQTVRRRVDPALVEWAGPGIFQTKVFPLLPNQLHRVIVGYDVMLTDVDDERVFQLDLPEGEAGGRVEFDVAALASTEVVLDPQTESFISGKRAYYRYENAEPRDYLVRLRGTQSVVLNTGRRGVGDTYFATRLKADLPDDEAKSETDQAVILLDTSWSDRPAAFARRVELATRVLTQNRDTIKEFAVLLFNVEQRWWRPEFVANNKKNLAALIDDINTLGLEGATDLHSALRVATNPKWDKRTKPQVPPNLFLFSDASASWGRTDLASVADPLRELDRSLGGGALFAYHLAGHRSDKAAMQWLADASGGAVFSVAQEADLNQVATAHRSRPWRIVSVKAKGANEILVQGATKTVYPNQTLTIAGHGQIDDKLTIKFQRGAEKKVIEFAPEHSVASPSAARLYGQLAVERLEPYGEGLEEITTAFARYFRVPGRTCSMVMLEGAEDYKRFGVDVPPAEDRLVIASTSVTRSIDDQEEGLLESRRNPHQRFTTWVQGLQAASLVKVPTALRLAMKRLPDDSFSFDAKPLYCKSWKQAEFGNDYSEELKLEAPGFDAVMQEAERKLIAFGADDAIKTASTLIDAKPSDVDTLRSVAFRSIQWQRSDQAAPLLWRLAQARPYQPQCLLLLARAMSDSTDTDAAIVCYDLVCNGNWNSRWAGAKQIAQLELLHLLERVDSGEVDSSIPNYARARLSQLRDTWSNEGLDLAVVMHWNTDRTDVDLHVVEPGGEECFYSYPKTKSGGSLTMDITEGLGPEMYSLKTAPEGEYNVLAKFYSSDNNRTKAPTETLLTVFHNVGRPGSQSQTKGVRLSGKGEKQLVMKVTVNH